MSIFYEIIHHSKKGETMSIIAPVTVTASMATASLGVMDTILNHSGRMTEIENSYKLEKKKMDYAYKFEVQKIENEMKQFKENVEVYRENSKNQHLEQMKLLENAQELIMKILELNDMQKCEIFLDKVEKYLAIYEQDRNKRQGGLNSHKPLAIGQ